MTDTFRVGIVDYEMGNLHSAAKALALQDCAVSISSDPATLRESDLLVLPGVGAFGAAMKQLTSRGLDDFIRKWVLEDNRPFLGMCLGLQLLFDSSEEADEPGLGILKGRVVRFQPSDFADDAYRVPHMGWNSLDVAPAGRPYCDGIGEGDRVYFVHTYFAEPADANVIATTTDYGRRFCSSVATDRLFAAQFHPEKSGSVGLRLLSNVVARARREKARC